LVQAVFWQAGACPLRLNTYVDDPICVVRGSATQRRQLVSELILLFRALGLPLAFGKGRFGPAVDWIGLSIRIDIDAVVVTIAAHRVQELLELTKDGLRNNVVSRKWLQSYAGKASNFASVLVFWRPFLQFLWAALYTACDSSTAPQNCIWVKQIQVSLVWIQAFLTEVEGDLCRRFTLDAFRGRGPRISLTFDASPWGAGGYLMIDNVLVSWFATEFTSYDALSFDVTFGNSSVQQLAEALAVLFGVRAWDRYWINKAAKIQVRSDSVSALSMVARMKSASKELGLVARELALTLSQSCVRPTVAEHTPGVANKLADSLSRRYQPGNTWRLPQALRGIPEESLLRRDGYYRTLSAPR